MLSDRHTPICVTKSDANHYFSAPSDNGAAAVIDRVGGPGSQRTQLTPYVEPKRSMFGRKRQAVAPRFGSGPMSRWSEV